MDELSPVDRENLSSQLGPHWQTLRSIHRAHLRLYATGGIATVVLMVVIPIAWGSLAQLTALQYFLVSGGALLVSLAAVRTGARIQQRRFRAATLEYCQRHQADLGTLIRAARTVPRQLYFFTAVWDGHEVDNA